MQYSFTSWGCPSILLWYVFTPLVTVLRSRGGFIRISDGIRVTCWACRMSGGIMLHGLVCLPGLKTRGRMDFKWPSHCSQVKIEAGVGTRDYLLTSLVMNTQGQPKHCWINNKCPSSTMRVSTAVEDGFKMCVGKQGQGCNLWLLSLPLPESMGGNFHNLHLQIACFDQRATKTQIYYEVKKRKTANSTFFQHNAGKCWHFCLINGCNLLAVDLLLHHLHRASAKGLQAETTWLME